MAHSRHFEFDEASDLSDVERDVEVVEGVVDGAGGHHEAGVDSPTDDSTQRIPRNAFIIRA